MQWKITSTCSQTDLIDVAIANQFLSRWTLKLYPRKLLGGLTYADPDSDALVALNFNVPFFHDSFSLADSFSR